MDVGHAVPLDTVDARHRDVEQRVDEVIGEEVDLVDVEHAAVRGHQQPWAELRRPILEKGGDVDRAKHAVLGGAEGELDERRPIGQERGEAACERGLGRAFLPAQQHPGEARLRGGQQQGELGVVLSDYRGERETIAHRDSSHPSASSRAARSVVRASGVAFHMPRSSASSSRSAIERMAHGFDCSKNFRTSGSAT